MKIDFRGQHFCRIDKKISVCYNAYLFPPFL